MPACSWSALRRTSLRLPGGVSNRSAAAMTANKSAPERFDDDPARLFRCIVDRIFTKVDAYEKLLRKAPWAKKRRPEKNSGPHRSVRRPLSYRYPATIPAKLPDAI